MSSIPIANLYYLLCYAWDRLEEKDNVSAGVDGNTSLPELFARVLETGVGRLLRRGLGRTYVEHEEEISGIRGRLDLGLSVKRGTFARASAVCVFDELSPDTLPNQILKSTIRELARVRDLDQRLADRLRLLYRRFAEVRSIRLDQSHFQRAGRIRASREYSFLLDVCELVHRNLLVDERAGEVMFRDFTRDDDQMARLFERFLFRFFETEQSRYRVATRRLNWRAEGAAESAAYIPSMLTDICLESGGHTIVIDAKYYATALSERFGKHSVRSGHLYQLFSYMHHVSPLSASHRVSGALIYPRTSNSLNVQLHLSGFFVQAVAVDLSQPWNAIHDTLLEVVDHAHAES